MICIPIPLIKAQNCMVVPGRTVLDLSAKCQVITNDFIVTVHQANLKKLSPLGPYSFLKEANEILLRKCSELHLS